MLRFFPKEAFLEPLCKILIFHKLCSERSYATFFKNHDIYINEKLVEDSKIHVDRETTEIKIFLKERQKKLSFLGKDNSVTRKSLKSTEYMVLPPQRHLYLLMNKPVNCVCSRVSDQSKTVYSVLKEELKKMGFFSLVEDQKIQSSTDINLDKKITEKQFNELSSLGRLDKNTTGLLLFSTNGSFNHFITDKKNDISKTYYVKLKKSLTKEEQEIYKKKLKSGIYIREEKKAKAMCIKNQNVDWESCNTCFFTISQGIFHQVRRSFVTLGNEVEELHRVKIGNLELPSDLGFGEIRIL